MAGTLYSVGIGPGEAELMTLKAVRLIKEAEVIAVPQGDNEVLTAKNIVSQIVNLDKKEQLMVYMPMTKDMKKMDDAHDKGAEDIIKYLKEGKNVVFITLGDPTIYATCIYVHKRVLAKGFNAELVPGVPSFCAVAAKLNVALCERSEPVIILPGSYAGYDKYLKEPGNKVLMKSASQIGSVRDAIKKQGLLKNAAMIERCGLPGEKIYWNLEDVNPESSYFSIILVKDKEIKK